MNYLPYIVAAYVIFAAVLAWDFITPRLQIRRILRTVRLRLRREKKTTDAKSVELTR